MNFVFVRFSFESSSSVAVLAVFDFRLGVVVCLLFLRLLLLTRPSAFVLFSIPLVHSLLELTLHVLFYAPS